MMTEYLLTALGVIFFAVVAGLIIPEGKLKKSINFVLRLVCVCILIQPVTNLFGIEEGGDGVSAEYDYGYICDVYSENQSKLLTGKVSEELGEDCVCTVSVEYIDGAIRENGVSVEGNFGNDKVIEKITEYLLGLGYINITVNDQSG